MVSVPLVVIILARPERDIQPSVCTILRASAANTRSVGSLVVLFSKYQVATQNTLSRFPTVTNQPISL